MDAKSPNPDFWQQKRAEYLRLRSPLLRPTPNLTEYQPVTRDELEEAHIELDYEIQLEKRQQSGSAPAHR